METRQRRSFTDYYKRRAVDLVASRGRSIGSSAKVLGFAIPYCGAGGSARGWKERTASSWRPVAQATLPSRTTRRNERLRMERDISKKSIAIFAGTWTSDFASFEDRRADYPVTVLCDVFAVSPAGYYAGRSRPESRRSAPIVTLFEDIKRVHRDTKRRYGSPHPCRAEGSVLGVSRGRIERLIGQRSIRAIMARPRRVRTTGSRHDFPIAPNLLERNFTAAARNGSVPLLKRACPAPNDGGIYVFGRIWPPKRHNGQRRTAMVG
jgi:transposase-like protein